MPSIVTGLFRHRRELDRAVEHLCQEYDVPRERIEVFAPDAEGGRSPEDDDLMAAPEALGNLPEAVRRDYEEGVRQGGVLLVARVEDAVRDRALHACRDCGSVQAAAHPADASADEEHVRVRAYYLWEAAGRPEGRDQEFWHRANRPGPADDAVASRAPQQFAGETGSAPLPEGRGTPDR